MTIAVLIGVGIATVVLAIVNNRLIVRRKRRNKEARRFDHWAMPA